MVKLMNFADMLVVDMNFTVVLSGIVAVAVDVAIATIIASVASGIEVHHIHRQCSINWHLLQLKSMVSSMKCKLRCDQQQEIDQLP